MDLILKQNKMSINGSKIIDSIRHIANGSANRHSVMMGKVIAVDGSECTVLLSVDLEENPTEGVLLNGVEMYMGGVYIRPAVDSTVWVAEIDGPGKWGVVKTSIIDEFQWSVGDPEGSRTQMLVNSDEVNIVNNTAGGDGTIIVARGTGVHIEVNGVSLKDVLDGLIDQIKLITVPTAVGPSGVPVNAAAFDAVKGQLDGILV